MHSGETALAVLIRQGQLLGACQPPTKDVVETTHLLALLLL